MAESIKGEIMRRHSADGQPNLFCTSEVIEETPTPEEIKEARTSVGLTQTQAAELVSSKLRTWQGWEYAGNDTRRARKMPIAIWELFLLKTGQIELIPLKDTY